MKGFIPLLTIDEILHSAGAERVDEKASRKLDEILEASAKELASKALSYARHAGRKTVSKKDVALAAEHLLAEKLKT